MKVLTFRKNIKHTVFKSKNIQQFHKEVFSAQIRFAYVYTVTMNFNLTRLHVYDKISSSRAHKIVPDAKNQDGIFTILIKIRISGILSDITSRTDNWS